MKTPIAPEKRKLYERIAELTAEQQIAAESYFIEMMSDPTPEES
jgi:hypothetical protein